MTSTEKIIKTLEKISFPRLSGTPHEKRAFDLVKKQIEDFQLDPQVQKFTFTKFYPRIYKKLVVILLFGLFLAFFININIIFNLFLIFSIISSLLLLVIITRTPENIELGKEYQSRNLYVKLNSKNRKSQSKNYKKSKRDLNKNLQVLLISHIDSKSQRLPIKFRVYSMKVWIYTGIIITIFLVLKFLFLNIDLIHIILLISLIVNFTATISVLVNSTQNKSNGAIDNGSGVAIVLELLKYYSKPKHRPKNIDLWFVFTGCEETGTMGIRNFLKIIDEYDKKRIRYFNFDSIAQNLHIFGPLKREIRDKEFYNKFFELAENLNPTTHFKRYILALNRSDGYILKRNDYLGLGIGDKTSYKYIHSVNDKINKINPIILSKICKLFIDFFKKINFPSISPKY